MGSFCLPIDVSESAQSIIANTECKQGPGCVGVGGFVGVTVGVGLADFDSKFDPVQID